MPGQVRLWKVWKLPHPETLAWICSSREVTLHKGFQISRASKAPFCPGRAQEHAFPQPARTSCSSHTAPHRGQVPWPLPPHLTFMAAWQRRVNPHSHVTYENTEAQTSCTPSRARNDSHNSCPLPRGSATWVQGGVIAPP